MDIYSQHQRQVQEKTSNPRTIAYFKVFLWFSLALLITGGLALGIPYLLPLISKDAAVLSRIYIGMIVVSAIMMLPSYIILIVQSFRRNTKVMTVAYLIYAVGQGILLSALLFVLAPSSAAEMTGYYITIGLAFLATAGCFLVMGIFASIFKKTIPAIIPIIFVLLVGSLIISLVNIFIGSSQISWIISFVVFGALLLITAVDIWRLRVMVESGAVDDCPNIALWCAFTLYTDFIAIFVRILIYLLASKRN